MSEQPHVGLTSAGRQSVLPDLPVGLPEADDVRRRQLRHDIQHQLATISLLASLLSTADDVGASSRARSEQLLVETHWLRELLLAVDPTQADPLTTPWSPPAERFRVDLLTREVLEALRLTTPARVSFLAAEAWTYANRLAVWRAIRNLMENAFRASGPQGQLRVRVAVEGSLAAVQIDDDGPGFGSGPAGLASLGLSIVRSVALDSGGSLEVSSSDLGGGRVRLLLPAAPSGCADSWIGENGAAADL
jgi:signal transduction histidine kinase